MWILLFILSPIYVAVEASSYVDPLDSFTDSLLREVLFGRTIGDSDDPGRGGSPPLFGENFEPSLLEESKAFEARKEPSIRDKEYLEHSSLLFGNQYPNEGLQRQKPDGSLINPLKNNGVLPAYCLPPNPCPMDYTSADGCLEESNFENTAAFSREYQANQKCMCDTEHMFDCPGSTRENEIDALARTFENEDLAELALDRLIKTMEPLNPLLEGEKLPVVAKKAPSHSIK